MRNIILIAIFILSAIAPCGVTGQDIIQPEAPVLDYVTVIPSSGYARLNWISSVSTDVERYVVYSYINNNAFAVDTIKDGKAVSYTDFTSQARYKSVSYVVAAIDSSGNISLLSNVLSTVFLTAVNDSCQSRISLQWNSCLNPRHPVTGYSVSCSVNGGPVQVLDTVPDLSYVFSSYLKNTSYCFYITALNNDGPVSVSEKACVKTGREAVPGWVELSGLKVESPEISIAGKYDTGGDISSFRASRKNSPASAWVQVASASGAGGSLSFADPAPDTASVVLYRIAAISNCGTEAAVSSPVRNIVLSVNRVNNDVVLRWNNPYPGLATSYTLLRNTGDGFKEAATGLNDTLFTDDYAAFAYGITGESVVYRIKAEASLPHSGSVESVSSAAEITVTELITVGNAFTPDDDGRNDIFRPSLSFTPPYYEFVISTRAGVVLFRSEVPETGWDGRHNGKLMPPGTYLWSLRVKTPTGKMEKRNGTVVILP